MESDHAPSLARRRAAVALVAVAFALACIGSAGAAGVVVSGAWVRGTVPGQTTTGAFMSITAPEDSALVAVSTPVARAEIHETVRDGAMMRMRAVDAVPLPAGKTVELAPGGYHVMLVDLKAPLPADAPVTLTLTFRDKAGARSTQDVRATVRPLGGAPASGTH